MIKQNVGAIQYLQFPLLCNCKELAHGTFLRHGGVSQDEFSSLNFSPFQGDALRNVARNLKKGLDCLGLKDAKQSLLAHGKSLKSVVSIDQQTIDWECDGLTSQLNGIGLMVTHADCQAAIFYDPCEKALSVIHCGWKGNVQNIYLETILKMKRLYGSKPANLLVAISPSLGPEKAQFINYQQELPLSFWEYERCPFYFDLWGISRNQLLQGGVLPGHIEIANLCTYSLENDFFSYRRQGARSGRHATIAAIR